ncbi:hypothetical protein BBJ28_00018891, partial [Nothophytophthora sp. Chile5]
LYVSYYRKRVYADLLPDGSIRFKDMVYTSPVPCALQMKRTLNPSALKTDAGWSSMFSAASGESLKDMKDRVNIRKRGTNARTANKEKRTPAPSPTAKERTAQAAAESVKRQAAPVRRPSLANLGSSELLAYSVPDHPDLVVWLVLEQKCDTCRKDATTDVVKCTACQRKTHFACAHPPLEAVPSAPWFCEKCLTSQANRILEFLQQTRRVLVETIAEQKAGGETQPVESENVSMEDAENAAAGEAESNEKEAVDASEAAADATGESSKESTEKEANEAEQHESDEPAAATTAEDKTAVAVAGKNGTAEEKKMKKEAIEAGAGAEVAVVKDGVEPAKTDSEGENVDEADSDAQLAVADRSKPLSVRGSGAECLAEEKFLVLIDSLIEEVSSKKDRAHLIANSTGATLVHLEKTQLVQLVEYGKREILAATRSEDDEEEEDEEGDETDEDRGGSASSVKSEVDALIKIFDLRHQILSSQSQFERTTSTLARRTEKHLRRAEIELMQLEESRTMEASAVMKIVDLINQYTSDLGKCEQKIHYNQMLLESISHRRNFIRSSNINKRFVPSYRYSTKLMTTSSDQLLLTVLLDKLRDIADSVNEWRKMENHFEKMTSSLNESLTLIGTKRKRSGAAIKLPPTPALFAKVKIPPSRRLIERQIANYEVNLNAIRQNRTRMRKTLGGILKIAHEEHLSEEIINMTELLFQKCRDLKAEEEEEQLRLKEEAEAKAKEEEDDQDDDEANAPQHGDGGDGSAEEPDAKKPRMDKADSLSDNSTGASTSSSTKGMSDAAAKSHASGSKTAPSSDVKGISSLLGNEDSNAKGGNGHDSSSEGKVLAGKDDDSEGDLEQASRAIADITSSQAAQMGMDMHQHDVLRHQDSSHFVGSTPPSLRGSPYMAPSDVSRGGAQQPAPTAARSGFYGDDGQPGQLHSQDVFGAQSLSGQQRQLQDHHMFGGDLQQQQQQQQGQQARSSLAGQDFLMGRTYRDLNGNNMTHPGMDPPDGDDVSGMGEWN